MKKTYLFIFAFLILFSNCTILLAAQTQYVDNNMGTGSDPRLQLVLSANGTNSPTLTIDYGAQGPVPYSLNSSNNWSSWNVFDTNDPPNYYGTINLKSDGVLLWWNGYSPGTQGYYLEGITLDNGGAYGGYQLTVSSIVRPTGSSGQGIGPFPNTPLATPAVYPGTTDPIVLSVVGDRIVTNHGQDVLLKGIVRPSLEWNPQGQYFSTQDLSNIANWESNGTTARSNVIRLDLYQGYWFDSEPATVTGSYKQIINAIVYYATQLGMAVILDLHWTNAGYQSPMANQDSITFWQEVATDYQDFGTVLFELFNEPYNITTNVWLNGDGVFAGYQQLYDAVRGTGAQNICIVGGLDYAYDLSFVSPSFCVTGTNIVYCSHPYNLKGQPGYTGPGGTFDQNYQGIIGNFPLIFTEFGTHTAPFYPVNYFPIYANILHYVNTNHVHYSAFAWWVEPGNPQFPVLIGDWDGTAIYGGINVHNDLVQNPGTLIAGIHNNFVSFEKRAGIVGTTVSFNGSKFGRLGLFDWNFGDASSVTESSPRVVHNFLNPGVYVVQLTTRIGARLVTTSRTINVGSEIIESDCNCVIVSPPADVRLRKSITHHGNVINTITWKAPEPLKIGEVPLYYLVFRDQELKEFVGVVRKPNKNGTFKIQDKTKSLKNSYTVIGVDPIGNLSTPVTVSYKKSSLQNNC
ncbi:MAG: cellulase family glycosylhydrolase [Parachlamydiaceae bacterium]|nr:cellulase family glycosylhydrolase [Parachlamydiaceae bacterium]